MDMGSGPSAASSSGPPEPDVLTLDRNPLTRSTHSDSDLETSPKLDATSWTDDDDLNDVESLRRELDSALKSSPKHVPTSTNSSAKSKFSQQSNFSKDSRFLLDSAEEFVDRKIFPETYARKIQRVQLEDQQPPMLVRDHVNVARDPVDWELEEDQILGFDVSKFKAANKVENTFITQRLETSAESTEKNRSPVNVEYDRFEEEIMAAIERDF